MQGISAAWLYPIILIAGALQAWGPPMNGALRNSLTNPWLASLVSFLPVVAFLTCVVLCQPRPLPTVEGVGGMPWWAPLGGLIGAFAVVAGHCLCTGSERAPSPGSRSPQTYLCRSRSIDLDGSEWKSMNSAAGVSPVLC
jgi:hypothetical protein